jgi:hypothetical protein
VEHVAGDDDPLGVEVLDEPFQTLREVRALAEGELHLAGVGPADVEVGDDEY